MLIVQMLRSTACFEGQTSVDDMATFVQCTIFLLHQFGELAFVMCSVCTAWLDVYVVVRIFICFVSGVRSLIK